MKLAYKGGNAVKLSKMTTRCPRGPRKEGGKRRLLIFPFEGKIRGEMIRGCRQALNVWRAARVRRRNFRNDVFLKI